MFRRSEYSTMVGCLWLANGLASTFGGLIGYGSAQLNGVRSLAGWQVNSNTIKNNYKMYKYK